MDFDDQKFEDASSELPGGENSTGEEQPMIFERNVQEHYPQEVAGRPTYSRSGSFVVPPGRPGSVRESLSRQGSFSAAQFPRSVPSAVQDGPRSSQVRSGEEIGFNHSKRHALEDQVAPALDASATLVTDKETDLDNVEMIYSGRNSCIGLDRALGRNRANSNYQLPQLSRANSTTSAVSIASANSNASNCSNGTSTASDRPRILRFYSYADMISDENAHSRRPSLTQSTSSSVLRQSPQPSFSNPFHSPTTRRDSASSALGLSAPSLSSRNLTSQLRTTSRSPSIRIGTPINSISPSVHSCHNSSNPSSNPVKGFTKSQNKFVIESSGSDCSTSEGENEEDSDQDVANSPNSPTSMLNSSSPPNSQALYNTVTGPRLTRTSTQNSFKKGRPIYKVRTYSNASSMSPLLSTGRSLQSHQGPTQNMNDVLFDDGLQSNSVGEVLRKKISNASEY
ncbi:LADA_0E09494g1_1 [Lachancea dasiensis]|uniref:LADA_0E09494g1_1 n=1 Tax=Lachancea dasiensis TaxID=1072105 RepID=A0A1G4JDZ8_9SACH|nr:LADA_0E09494g1_1 [Lachancea dasiensis]